MSAVWMDSSSTFHTNLIKNTHHRYQEVKNGNVPSPRHWWGSTSKWRTPLVKTTRAFMVHGKDSTNSRTRGQGDSSHGYMGILTSPKRRQQVATKYKKWRLKKIAGWVQYGHIPTTFVAMTNLKQSVVLPSWSGQKSHMFVEWQTQTFQSPVLSDLWCTCQKEEDVHALISQENATRKST